MYGVLGVENDQSNNDRKRITQEEALPLSVNMVCLKILPCPDTDGHQQQLQVTDRQIDGGKQINGSPIDPRELTIQRVGSAGRAVRFRRPSSQMSFP